MKKRRPISEPAPAPDGAGDLGASPLKVVELSDPPQGSSGIPSGDTGGSLELMFNEISSGDSDHRRGHQATPDTGKYDELWQLALADPLTGLANRMLLLDRLNRELARRQRHGGCVIVSHIDLNNLKDINDELGYSSGNEVLRGVSRRLTSLLRTEDTVSRVAESQLVAVMTTENEEAVDRLMQRLQDAFEIPIAVSGRQVRVSVSFGMVTAGKAESAEEVLARAGLAA